MVSLTCLSNNRALKGISFLNNFKYTEQGIRVWKAYSIGEGQLIKWGELSLPPNNLLKKIKTKVSSTANPENSFLTVSASGRLQKKASQPTAAISCQLETQDHDSDTEGDATWKEASHLLPVAQHLLEPEIQSDVERKLTKKRRKAKKYFDRGSKELPELEIGQPIRLIPSPMDTSRKWRREVCIKKVAPRSYLVDVKGSIYRRNRKFLRIAKDRLPGTVQENRQQLNPETAQANPGTQTPCQQLKPPLPASWSPLDNIPESQRLSYVAGRPLQSPLLLRRSLL